MKITFDMEVEESSQHVVLYPNAKTVDGFLLIPSESTFGKILLKALSEGVTHINDPLVEKNG